MCLWMFEMNIFEFNLFNNETLIADVKIRENAKWTTKTYITESNLTHSYLPKSYNFEDKYGSLVEYIQLDGCRYFSKPGYGISGKFPFFRYKDHKWKNDGIHRNLSVLENVISDDDIIVISDIDEIVMPELAPEIIRETLRHGIVTFKMYYTLVYFDLLSPNMGAPDWSYRVFFMTGKYFKGMHMTIDQLRKAGERGQLISEVYCIPKYCGFHHSWVGNVDFIINKFKSYAHNPTDFGKKLLINNELNIEYIRYCIDNNRSFLNDGQILKRLNVNLLQSVESLRVDNPQLFAY